MYVSVVVPCYRSASTLPDLVAGLSTVLPVTTSAYEVILVVDGSPDNTWEVASKLAAEYQSSARSGWPGTTGSTTRSSPVSGPPGTRSS